MILSLSVNSFAEGSDTEAEQSDSQSESGSEYLWNVLTAIIMFAGVSFFGVLFIKSMQKDKSKH